MTITCGFLKIILRVPAAHIITAWLIRILCTYPYARKWLNICYNSLKPREKILFYHYFAKIFRSHDRRVSKGTWTVTFLNKQIVVPFSGTHMWLEWDLALSILGHEPEITVTYKTLLMSKVRPTLFFDIGANYGLHSLLFLTHGIPTVSFEPNTACHETFNMLCQANTVTSDLQTIALSDQEGTAELWFQEKETWAGTIITTPKDGVLPNPSLKRLPVKQITLDAFISKTGYAPQLIKIDTEGFDLKILRGGMKTLSTARPFVIFESFRDATRSDFFDFFKTIGYSISSLPVLQGIPLKAMDPEQFNNNPPVNYLAFPDEFLLQCL